MRPIRSVALSALVAVGALLACAGPAGAGGARSGQEPQEVRRVLVYAVPGLHWADIENYELPALEGFLADAAVADMAPRSVAHRSTPGEAYLTISAGTRATTDESVDGQVLALDEGDLASPAGEIYQRRTGVEPTGEYVALGWPRLVRLNDRQPYNAEMGLLAEMLAENGVEASVIGNADGQDSVGASYERQVGLALALPNGQVEQGALTPDLLTVDPSRPFGLRFDLDAVRRAFTDAWADDGGDGDAVERRVVLLEASDMARTVRYRPVVDAQRYAELREQALTEADELFGDLLEQVDPERDAVMVIGPYLQRGRTGLTVAALRRPSSRPGYLQTATTQRAGIVSLVDVAPTILRTLDLDVPDPMEGRAFEVVADDDSLDERAAHLVQIAEASRFRSNLLTPTTIFLVLVLAAIVGLTVCTVAGEWPSRARALVRFAVLAALAVFPMSYVARGFPLEDLGVGFYWTFLIASSLVVAALATLLSRRSRSRAGLLAVLGLVLVVLFGDVATGSNLSLSAAFGYSPTGNSRLYGISNYSFGQVAGASCVLAALIASAWPSRRGRLTALALLGITLVIIGVPTWGSDVGGVIAFTPTVLAFAALVYRYRVRVRDVLIATAVTAVAIAVFGLIDLARPRTERAHLGRLFERVGKEGLQPLLSISERKFEATLEVSTSSFWMWVIPIGIAFWLFLSRYPGRPLSRVKERVPALHAGLVAAAIAAVLGSFANDSGAIVGGVTVLVVTASLAYLVVERPVLARPLSDAADRSERAGHAEHAERADRPPGEPRRAGTAGVPAQSQL